jgi:hypothetical protein
MLLLQLKAFSVAIRARPVQTEIGIEIGIDGSAAFNPDNDSDFGLGGWTPCAGTMCNIWYGVDKCVLDVVMLSI